MYNLKINVTDLLSSKKKNKNEMWFLCVFWLCCKKKKKKVSIDYDTVKFFQVCSWEKNKIGY